MTFELPGMDEKDVEVELKDNVLTIKGEKKAEKEEKEETYTYMRTVLRVLLSQHPAERRCDARQDRGLVRQGRADDRSAEIARGQTGTRKIPVHTTTGETRRRRRPRRRTTMTDRRGGLAIAARLWFRDGKCRFQPDMPSTGRAGFRDGAPPLLSMRAIAVTSPCRSLAQHRVSKHLAAAPLLKANRAPRTSAGPAEGVGAVVGAELATSR